MTLLETTQKYRAESEAEAKEMMEDFRHQAGEKGYTIKKMGYEYKTKKAKGEIIDDCYILSLTQVFDEVWGE